MCHSGIHVFKKNVVKLERVWRWARKIKGLKGRLWKERLKELGMLKETSKGAIITVFKCLKGFYKEEGKHFSLPVEGKTWSEDLELWQSRF